VTRVKGQLAQIDRVPVFDPSAAAAVVRGGGVERGARVRDHETGDGVRVVECVSDHDAGAEGLPTDDPALDAEIGTHPLELVGVATDRVEGGLLGGRRFAVAPELDLDQPEAFEQALAIGLPLQVAREEAVQQQERRLVRVAGDGAGKGRHVRRRYVTTIRRPS